jgi:hypothetical protein
MVAVQPAVFKYKASTKALDMVNERPRFLSGHCNLAHCFGM